ncbi:MAG: hypothetical protein HQL65_08400 [Magnetococcales bacterium]|nr:hypothetical protein [Magnetococcales bacterium]
MIDANEIISKIEKDISMGRIVYINDVIEICKRLNIESLPLFLVSKRRNKIIPSLSFALFPDRISIFSTMKDVNVELEKCGIPVGLDYTPNNFVCYQEEFFNVYCKTTNLNDETVKCLLYASRLLNIHSQQSINITLESVKHYALKFDESIKNGKYSLIDFCKYINLSHNIKSYAFHILPDKTLFPIISNNKKNIDEIIECISKYALKEINESVVTGRVMTNKEHDLDVYYIIVPVINKYNQKTPIRNIIIATSYEPFSKLLIETIISYCDIYMTLKRSDMRVDALIGSREDIISIQKLPTFATHEDFIKTIKDYSQDLLEKVIHTTQAFSATLRYYDPHLNALVKISEATDDIGTRDIDEGIINNNRLISCKKWRSSVNAYTFKMARLHDGFVYLRNLNLNENFVTKNNIPKIYRVNGLQGWLQWRKKTRSEICIQISNEGVPFAVMNIESNIPFAFTDDIDYLKGIANAISQYHALLLLKNDKNWLRKRILEIDGKHELLQHYEMDTFNEFQKEILNETIFKFQATKSDILKCGNILFFNVYVQYLEWIFHVYRSHDDEQIEILRNIVRNHVKKDVKISYDTGHAILSILKNITQNIVRHGQPELDNIIIYYHEDKMESNYDLIFNKQAKQTGKTDRNNLINKQYFQSDAIDKNAETLQNSQTNDQGHGFFKIRFVAKEWYSNETFISATLSPVDKKSERLHFGLFLVGVLTRIHGGIVFIGGEPEKGRVVVECHIPNNESPICKIGEKNDSMRNA